MNRTEALERAEQGLPIESLREVVFVLAELQRARTVEGEPAWYLLNRLQRVAIEAADFQEGCTTVVRAIDKGSAP